MLNQKSTITNECIFSEDRTHRYLMSRIWNKNMPIPLFVTKSCGKADGIYLELTNNIITNNLYQLGYGGYYAVNLYSAVSESDPVKFNQDTDEIIRRYAKQSSEIIIAWGTLTSKALKAREAEVIQILKTSKKKLLTVCDHAGRKNLHPLTASVRQGFLICDFRE